MMRVFKRCFLTGIVLVVITLSCSIKAPEVRVTGEKTALEREVIGTYHQMEEDTWMIASTRATKGEREVKISPEKQRVLEALQRQKFNKDDVDEFKKKGYVGENSEGLLEIRQSDELIEEGESLKLIQAIVEEENEDRETVVDRVIELNQSLKNAVRKNILVIFAQMYQENSPVGTWIQRQFGEWEKK